MKRFFALILLVSFVALWGCAGNNPQQYSITYYDLFDTVTTLKAHTETKADFDETAENIHAELLEYHKLFDIYNPYSGIVNLYSINETAGIAPVQADSRIIDLLLYCKQAYTVTEGKVNAAMGAVLGLWHDARNASLDIPEQAFLPDQSLLESAAQHTNFDDVIIDQDQSTVYFSDPSVRLDVGAIAKGWATQKVTEKLPSGWLLSVGGNICLTGPKADGSPWTVAVQHPDDPSAYLLTVSVSGGCVVTSGDYQRTYTVDGKNYHHIIDPATLYPGTLWRAVTVICSDSATADMLSTALFLLSLEDGKALLTQYSAEAVWMDAAGELHYSAGFPGRS